MEGEISERKKEQLATVIMYTTVQNKQGKLFFLIKAYLAPAVGTALVALYWASINAAGRKGLKSWWAFRAW